MRTIYNTSFIINESIEAEWVCFMHKNYLSIIKNNKLCRDIIFTKVSIDQPDGKTYSLQLVFDSEQDQNYFFENWLPDLEKMINSNYINRYLCFSSILTEI